VAKNKKAFAGDWIQ